MNNTQRILLAVYLPFTLLILLFDYWYPYYELVANFRFAVMMTMFLTALFARKTIREQKWMTLSFLFLIIGDFFLVFAWTLPNFPSNMSLFGIASFSFAYLCLIVAYRKKAKIGKLEVLTAIPISFLFVLLFFVFKPHLSIPMLIAIGLFGLVLSYMTWTAVCTIFRGYYQRNISRKIAISAIMMLVCDLGVGMQLFYPVDSHFGVLLLNWITWAVYIPGWMMLLMVITTDTILEQNITKE